MRIARITRAFRPKRDGISNHTYFLSKYQAELGHDVVVFQPHMNSSVEHGFEIVKVNLGPLTGRYGMKLVTGMFTAEALLAAWGGARRKPFDILHVHGDIVEIAIACGVARLKKVPLVVTAHSRLNSSPKYASIARKLWRQVDGAIVVSPEIASQLQQFGVEARRIAVITSGVETDRFRTTAMERRAEVRARLGLSDRDLAVISVGRLTEMKGYEYLIESAGRLSDASNSRILIYIAGEGPLKDRLCTLAHGTGRIRFLGSVQHEGISELLGAADIFVLPSVDRPGEAEGTPTAVMEAMACGLPVIVTDSGGARHVIENRVGVTVVPQRDPASLAAAMETLAANPDLRRELGAANRARVADHDWSLISRRVSAFYGQAAVAS